MADEAQLRVILEQKGLQFWGRRFHAVMGDKIGLSMFVVALSSLRFNATCTDRSAQQTATSKADDAPVSFTFVPLGITAVSLRND